MKFSKIRRQQSYTATVTVKGKSGIDVAERYAIEKLDSVWKAYRGTQSIGEFCTLRGAKLCCEADAAALQDDPSSMAIHIASIVAG